MSAGGLSFRTSAHGLLRSGYRGGKPLRHPALFHRANPRIRLFRSLSLRTAPHSVIESACAYGFGSLSTALQKRIRLSTLHRVSACFAALTPDVLRCDKPNAQQVVLQRLMAHHCTLNDFNRLVLHSRSLQARCSRCARGCRWAARIRSPTLCHLHAKHITAL